MIIRDAMLGEYFGAGSFGKLLGITMGMASLGGMRGPPPLAGWVFDRWGTFQPIWFAFCGFIAISIAFICMIRPR